MRMFFQVVMGAALLSMVAFAQETAAPQHHPLSDDAYQVRYAANLGAGDSIINLTNAGSAGGREDDGDICANVYVFDDMQELIACCACPLTPNHLQTLSVKGDLTSNTLTPGVPNDVTVALLATEEQGGSCDPANLSGHWDASNSRNWDVETVPGLRAWGTTLHAAPGGGFAVTETEFSQAKLSDSELYKLTSFCGFIKADGSGYGICGSCKLGAAGAAKQ